MLPQESESRPIGRKPAWISSITVGKSQPGEPKNSSGIPSSDAVRVQKKATLELVQ
jgi:hypothetical protein